MKPSICLYFQVHQPLRLRRDYTFFDIGSDQYEDCDLNRSILDRVSNICYLPANDVILKLLKKYPGKFKISFSLSGVVLEQFEKYRPDVLRSFQELVATGDVEILGESYYHSLAFVHSHDEFKEQVRLHGQYIKKLFNIWPSIFRNTELIYNNEIAQIAADLGFKAILTEGVKNSNLLYKAKNSNISVLLKNYKRSDDVAFRFTDKSWADYPLTPAKFVKSLLEDVDGGDLVNLFMDYETFGEHHKEQSGIFDFLNGFVQEVMENSSFSFITPTNAITSLNSVQELDIADYISWADTERDISAWLGNSMQKNMFNMIFAMEDEVKNSGNLVLQDRWRKLQTSDHLYYASLKKSSDGDVHNYFSPYISPHEAFLVCSNIINDLKFKVLKETCTRL